MADHTVSPPATLRLKPREDRRLRAGHLWVYSNEIDTTATPLSAFAPGDLCRLEDARGKSLGLAYVHPKNLLCARLLSSRSDRPVDTDWFIRRLRSALALRDRLYPEPYYRLVHGEGDGLPGVVVDRYGDVLVVQIGTVGMERFKSEIVDALTAVLQPRGIWLRNDGVAREAEGLPLYVEAAGDPPPEVELLESGVRFGTALDSGQKTGWFYDQRDNRDRFMRYVSGQRVLDVFCYAGGWGVRAAVGGASQVAAIDSSEPALAAVRANAQTNGVVVETMQGDALERLKRLHAEGLEFDVVVVDPPALVKRRKDFDAGFGHYAALNRAAMQLLPADGILVSCSCSFHLDEAQLQRVLLRESRGLGRRLQLLETLAQGADHPVHPAMPETRYLKGFIAHVSDG